MKAFIFVALVASVAARSLDLETLRLVNKEKSLLNRPEVTKLSDDLLLKEQQLNKNVVVGQENLIGSTVFPVQDKTFGGIYDNTVVDTDRVLTIQELYSTELFKEYLSIPLFRQYIQYPSFQRFISSVYFQRFWQLPAYKQYFINPVLFYKYVYPIVQLFKTEYNLPSVYGQHEDVLGLQTLVDDVLLNKNKNFLPYAYNYNRFAVPTTAFQGTTTNYKFLLEKLHKNLIPQQQPYIADIKTDVKLIPTEKVVVEPITNQVVLEEPKIVDVQVDSKIVPFTTQEKTFDSFVITEQDVLLLKELLREQIITPEVYQAVIVGKVNYITVLRQVLVRGQVSADLLNQIVGRLQVIETIAPVDTTVVLTEKYIVILKDLVQKNIITPEIYQAVFSGKIDFTTVLRQVLERRGLTTDLINLIISRFFTYETTVVITEKDAFLLKELLRQQIITPEVYQTVLAGKVDFFTLLHQVIVRRDVIDTIYPFADTTTVVLTERNLALLKELYRQNIISHDIYQAVILGKYDFVTILRQVLERRGFTSDLVSLFINRLLFVDTAYPVSAEQDFALLKQLLRQNIITPEIYQAVVFGKIDIYTVLRQVIFRRDVVDTVFPYSSTVKSFDYGSGFNKYYGNDYVNKYYGNDYVNKYYGNDYVNKYYKYNTEIPTIRDTTFNAYNRYPIVA